MTLREKTSLPKIESTRSTGAKPASGERTGLGTVSFASLMGVPGKHTT
jgi:hypothetical protein